MLGVGLEPVTDLDFGLADSIGTEAIPYALTIDATGGIQAVTLGLGQRLGSRLYLGLRMDLIVLGTISETWTKEFQDESVLNSEDKVVRTHRGVVPAAGVIYAPSDRWSLGLAFQPGRTVRQTRRLRNIFVEDLAFEGEVTTEGDIQLPAALGMGIAYTNGYRWVAALDAERSFWSDTKEGRFNTLDVAVGFLYRTGQEDPLVRTRRIELTGACTTGPSILQRPATSRYRKSV